MTEQEKIEARKSWRFRWLGELFLFAYTEFQSGLWFEGKYPDLIGCFSEDICKYFDDLSLDDNYVYQLENKRITLAEYDCICDFHFALDQFVEDAEELGNKFDECKILEDIQWLEVCELGKISWNKLKEIVSDENELKHMHLLDK